MWKSLLPTGYLYLTCSSQKLERQVLQKLCPHAVVTGLLNTSRQIEHEKLSSDLEVLAEAVATLSHRNTWNDHGRLTQNPWKSSRKHANFHYMATDFAPMQVNETHIPWPTSSHRNPWNEHGRLIQNPWNSHWNKPISVIWSRKSMTLIFRGTHKSPSQRPSRPGALNPKSVVASRNHLNCPWYAHGIWYNAS